jgi:hypothetical protein
MGRLSSFVFGVAVGGAAVFTSLKYHVVRTDEHFELVPKLNATFAETYVDIRDFDLADWSDHKTLMAALVRADKQEVLKNSAADSLADGMGTLLEKLGYAPDSKTTRWRPPQRARGIHCWILLNRKDFASRLLRA